VTFTTFHMPLVKTLMIVPDLDEKASMEQLAMANLMKDAHW